MKEEKLNLEAFDKKIIHGIHTTNDNNKLIIFIHGLTSHKNAHILCQASREFSKSFDSYRFDSYNAKEDARKLIDSTVETHTKDLNSAINYFSDKYEEIYLIAHSFGGSAIYNANLKNITAICLWDTILIKEGSKLGAKYKYSKELDCYILRQATDILVSKELLDSRQKLNPSILERIDKPTKIICAEKFIFVDIWKENINKIQAKTQYKLIKGASHIFSNIEHEKELFKETLNWFLSF